MVGVRSWRREKQEVSGTEFPFCKTKRILEMDGGDG